MIGKLQFISTLLILVTGAFSIVGAQPDPRHGFLILPDSSQWRVQVDDSLITAHQYPTLALLPGNHTLWAQAIYSKKWPPFIQHHNFTIQSGETLQIVLKPQQHNIFSASAITVAPTLQEIPPIRSLFSKRYIKPALLVTAFAANWASFAVKRQADDYYDIYNKTSDPAKMERYYNKTKNYDDIASALLGVSITTLSAYFYLLLTE